MLPQIHNQIRVAILHQAIEPPLINGSRKPLKPGGYQDSGADIAFCLYSSGSRTNVKMVSPNLDGTFPDPSVQEGWTFPDTPEGIMSAIAKGATHLWANTVLFSAHPLQTSEELQPYMDEIKIVGQPCNLVDRYDDKEWTNDLLRRHNSKAFTLPKAWGLEVTSGLDPDLEGKVQKWLELFGPELAFPVVGKPIRGRGSFGVKVCHTQLELHSHLTALLKMDPRAMVEQFLAGEEATVTVMPPSPSRPSHWALPIVVRYNHSDDVAPYSGKVAVTSNSRVVTAEEYAGDDAYEKIAKECEAAGKLLGTTAPIRIDIRRVSKKKGSKFAMFDVNMKPNMTGPGRPGREDQLSLCGLAAEGLGMSYEDLLLEMLSSARTLRQLRDMKPCA